MKKILLISDDEKRAILITNYIKKIKHFKILSILTQSKINKKFIDLNYQGIKIYFQEDFSFAKKSFKTKIVADFLSKQNLKSSKEIEFIFYKMLDYHDYDCDNSGFSIKEKKQIFYSSLYKILSFLEFEKPSIIIDTHIPHSYFAVLFAMICKLKKITYICSRHFGLPGIYTLCDSLFSRSPFHQKKIKHLKKIDKKTSRIVYLKIIKIFNNFKNDTDIIKLKKSKWQNNKLIFYSSFSKFFFFQYFLERIIVFYFSVLKSIFKFLLSCLIKGYISARNEFFINEEIKIKNRNFWKKQTVLFQHYISFKSDMKKFELIKQYKKYSISPNLKQKYIYFPLWFQPSASTYPFSQYYLEVMRVAKILALNKSGIKIYIKEHEDIFNLSRHAWTRGSYVRSVHLYRKLAKLNNVELVNISTSHHELIDNSFLVASQSTKNIFIALARNIPVLIFGDSLLNNCPGTFNIVNLKTLEIAIKKIEKNNNTPNNHVLNFLKNLSTYSYFTNIMNGFDGKFFFNTDNLYLRILKNLLDRHLRKSKETL